MEEIAVAAAVIRNNGKVLIAQRPECSHMGLKWEFPGGKIEPGEDAAACLKREIREELDLEIEVGRELMVVEHKYRDRKVIMRCHWCRYLRGEAKALECRSFKWVSAGEMKSFDFAEADRPVVDFLLKSNLNVQD
ncbi:8-oxo-dGTP diphosphatase MutT [Pelotomaculum propionicicum]|uniref:8-oxo-dGTP diphosphatase MutT n=1 Tax=Pelotomaculum propionicicum TaxID=258475 RepID=UPI003B762E0F